jgi:hypothetical protein
VDGDNGPGVPGALHEALVEVARRLGPATVDRLWIFPARIRGRKEWGLLAVSRLNGRGEGAEDDVRHLFTVTYTARQTGQGIECETSVTEEGYAPRDRLPRVMAGVVRRSDEEFGDDPREVEVAGDPQAWQALIDEIEPAGDPEFRRRDVP